MSMILDPKDFLGPYVSVIPANPKSPQPDPKVCPVCGKKTGFVWDPVEDDWILDGEWWLDPQFGEEDLNTYDKVGYICSKSCYLKRIA